MKMSEKNVRVVIEMETGLTPHAIAETMREYLPDADVSAEKIESE